MVHFFNFHEVFNWFNEMLKIKLFRSENWNL